MEINILIQKCYLFHNLKKRFVELPTLLVNFNDHFKILCKDIIINFYKGRKILVICNSIKEAKIIENELKKI